MQPSPPSLYKFGKRAYLKALLEEGVVSFAIATRYLDSALTEGQQDNEGVREFPLNVAKHQLLVGKGANPRALTNLTALNVTMTLKGRDGAALKYYLWCASLIYSDNLLKEFDADSCIRIHNPQEFGDRLLRETLKQFPANVSGEPGCDLYGRDVFYYPDGQLPPSTEERDLVFFKKNKYMQQNEFRYVFAANPKLTLPDRVEIRLGSLETIAEFYSE